MLDIDRNERKRESLVSNPHYACCSITHTNTINKKKKTNLRELHSKHDTHVPQYQLYNNNNKYAIHFGSFEANIKLSFFQRYGQNVLYTIRMRIMMM